MTERPQTTHWGENIGNFIDQVFEHKALLHMLPYSWRLVSQMTSGSRDTTFNPLKQRHLSPDRTTAQSTTCTCKSRKLTQFNVKDKSHSNPPSVLATSLSLGRVLLKHSHWDKKTLMFLNYNSLLYSKTTTCCVYIFTSFFRPPFVQKEDVWLPLLLLSHGSFVSWIKTSHLCRLRAES